MLCESRFAHFVWTLQRGPSISHGPGATRRAYGSSNRGGVRERCDDNTSRPPARRRTCPTSRSPGHVDARRELKVIHRIYIVGRCKCVIFARVEESYRGVSREIAVEGLEQAAILMVRHLGVRTGLGLTANVTLSTLQEAPARVTTLAAAASIRQPAMTELVQRLERQDLVTRV